jgi:hypothetical protein
MTREEVAAVISLMDGTAQVVAKLLYGSGLRIIVIIGDMIDKLARMGGAMRLNINHALDRHGSADVACVERSATQGVSRLQNYACFWPLGLPPR